MKGLSIAVIVATTAVSACATDQTAKNAPTPPGGQPSKPQTVAVEVIVDTKAAHEKRCSSGGVPDARTVLIADTEAFHCVKQKLFGHPGTDNVPDTRVNLASGDFVRFFSKESTFRLIDVEQHNPVNKLAPDNPFGKPFSPAFTNEAIAGPVVDVPGTVVQLYKMTFEVGTADKHTRVDPDVSCSM
jgi:hypothetical protein